MSGTCYILHFKFSKVKKVDFKPCSPALKLFMHAENHAQITMGKGRLSCRHDVNKILNFKVNLTVVKIIAPTGNNTVKLYYYSKSVQVQVWSSEFKKVIELYSTKILFSKYVWAVYIQQLLVVLPLNLWLDGKFHTHTCTCAGLFDENQAKTHSLVSVAMFLFFFFLMLIWQRLDHSRCSWIMHYQLQLLFLFLFLFLFFSFLFCFVLFCFFDHMQCKTWIPFFDRALYCIDVWDLPFSSVGNPHCWGFWVRIVSWKLMKN